MRLGSCVLLVYVASALVSSACNDSLYVQLNAPPHAFAPRSAADIEILSSGPPSRTHVDVGLFRFHGDISFIREEAAKKGCDALMLNTVDTATCVMFVGPS